MLISEKVIESKHRNDHKGNATGVKTVTEDRSFLVRAKKKTLIMTLIKAQQMQFGTKTQALRNSLE